MKYSFWKSGGGIGEDGPIHPENEPFNLQLESMDMEELKRALEVLKAHGFTLEKGGMQG